MGTSTNGQICYGILFEEGFEFPWDNSEWEDDIDDWWLHVSGWTWDKEQPFIDGDYAPGFYRDHPLIEEYFSSSRSWLKEHPLPVLLVNYQSGECPAYILAAPGTLTIARRGYPELITTDVFTRTLEQEESLVSFCQKYGIEYDTKPQWYLSSYWG